VQAGRCDASGHHNRLMIEYCCGEQSKIGQPSDANVGCKVIRITESVDARSDNVDRLLDLNDHFGPVMLFASIPCTGGSPWMNINKLHAGGLMKFNAHIKLFKQLWLKFEDLCERINGRGGHIAIEWPRMCSYWKWTCVVLLLARYDLAVVDFDGCACNLRSVAKPEMFVKKPWRIATNNRQLLAQLMNKRCPGIDSDHVHVPCQGIETKATEAYTEELVDIIHIAFRDSANVGLLL
jgi:hypothetical protein